jgi:hypothetical protein
MMLKKIVAFLIMLAFVLSAASYITGYAILAPLQQGMADEKNGEPVVSMSVRTDTEAYRSGELMETVVNVACSEELGPVIVKLYGIKDRVGSYKVNDEKIIEIKPPGNETSFLVRMPRCYGCAGVEPGEYWITSEVVYNGGIIANASKTVTLVQ